MLFGAALVLATAYGLGLALLRKTPAPPEIALALGAAAESFLVFLLLLVNAGRWYAFLAIGAFAAVCWRPFPRSPLREAVKRPLGKAWIVAAAIFGAYGLWYFTNALAPEILADGMTYHLGLPYEYLRLGGFPDRITFYDLVPQGMEMLYTAAFAFGRQAGGIRLLRGHGAAVFPHRAAARLERPGSARCRGLLLLRARRRRDGRLVL